MPLPPRDYEYFTLVFKGDIGKFKKNPMVTDTPYGWPVAAGRGNAFEEADELREALAVPNGNVLGGGGLGSATLKVSDLPTLPNGERCEEDHE